MRRPLKGSSQPRAEAFRNGNADGHPRLVRGNNDDYDDAAGSQSMVLLPFLKEQDPGVLLPRLKENIEGGCCPPFPLGEQRRGVLPATQENDLWAELTLS